MQYRWLGRTGLKISSLGFGAMRLPMMGEGQQARVDREKAIPLIHRAFELGVNYIDTAPGYCNDDGQRAVGEALADRPHPVVVSTKNMYYGEDEATWRRNLENSLDRLGVEAIDVYHHHAMNWKIYREQMEPRVIPWMLKARDEGLVRHVACSFHDSPQALLRLIETGYPEIITVQYNMLDPSLQEGLERAAERGIGVVVMGPVAGGKLAEPSEVLAEMTPREVRVPELALRFVLANRNVATAISGMNTPEQVDQNARVASDPTALRPGDLHMIEQRLERLRTLADLYCTGCRYCLPCPRQVKIPEIFQIYNRARIYGLWTSARADYDRLASASGEGGADAAACVECGQCEQKCPQHLPIREQLKHAYQALKTEHP